MAFVALVPFKRLGAENVVVWQPDSDRAPRSYLRVELLRPTAILS
jgi:hypothetical protein